MSKIEHIRCSNCDAANENSLSYCSQCGTPLSSSKMKSSGQNIALYILAVLLLLAIMYAYLSNPYVPSESTHTGLSRDEKSQYEKRLKSLELRLRDARKELSALKTGEDGEKIEIREIAVDALNVNDNALAGWLIVSDPWDRQIRKLRTGMTRNGWIAIPARACIGGNRWIFYPDSGGEYEISGGLWIGGDNVGLWQASTKSPDSAVSEITYWDDTQPVSWKSLESEKENSLVTLKAGPASGFFTSVVLPDDIDEAGIFVQGENIVGWTFGSMLEKGYMWPGGDGVSIEHNTWVRYFYDMTFAHGREEKFALALSMSNSGDLLEKLSVFAGGFRLEPRLSVQDTPEYLLPEEIIKKMRVLVTRAVQAGLGNRVVDILSSRVLKDINDIYLLVDVIRIMAQDLGYESAINEIEDSGAFIVRQSGQDAPALDKLHLQYYQGWLHDLLAATEIDEGWRVFNAAKFYFSRDPLIHLFGVELALLDGDWQEAERLLYLMEYPAAYQDRAQLLALQISELKGEEGRIVITFSPGSNRVTVDANVNEAVSQNFLVDTGATMVTITSATAQALGLRTGPANHTLSTVGGMVKAAAVVLDSIEIDGWIEYDVRAFVVDIPNRPGLGLLGINYLGRFQMDLQTDEGTLLLTPR